MNLRLRRADLSDEQVSTILTAGKQHGYLVIEEIWYGRDLLIVGLLYEEYTQLVQAFREDWGLTLQEENPDQRG